MATPKKSAASRAVKATAAATTATGSAVKKAPARRAATKKSSPIAEEVAPKSAPAKKTPTGTSATGAGRATKRTAARATADKADPKPGSSGSSRRTAAATGATKTNPAVEESVASPVRGVTKDGVAYTKDFDAKFLTAQRDLLLTEKQSLLGQAIRLEDEATALIEESEMGDVQFDDEGGEGDTMVVERERDLALSAQARQTIADIDAALERIGAGTYGYSVESGRPISRERLEAIPWASVLVEEKVGGIGRR